MSQEHASEGFGPTDESIRSQTARLCVALAHAAENFAAAMRKPLPPEHDVSCPTFCPGSESHAHGAIAGTLYQIARMQQRLADAVEECTRVIGATQLQKMFAPTAFGPAGE